MNPILFSKTATTFTSNGIGRLECISCVVIEERNGIYELEAVCPVQGNHVSDLEIDSILAVIPYDGGTMQGFRVYEITKPLNGRFTVYARHISYQLLNIPTAPFSVSASSSACATTLSTLKTNAYESCPFTFWTDVTTAGSYSQGVPAAIRSQLLGTEGSVLDQFGGEYEWDNYTVKLHRQRGTLAENNGIVLRYGKNITDIEQEENISNVITGVVPFWADTEGNVYTLPNKEVVYSQYASRYPFKRTVPLDLSDKWEKLPDDWQSALRTAAQAFVNNGELGVPKVSIEVSFVALWQSEEYKDVLPLQRVKLCDEITVIFEKYGIERIAKVVKTEYNVLKERYDKIQVGDVRSTFTTAVNDMNSQTIQQIEAQSVSTKEAINNATKWLTSTGGYVIANKNQDGSWESLVFADHADPEDWENLIKITNTGIGFSTDGGQSYTQAWTIDGNLVADFIHGGTLTMGGDNNGNGVISVVDANSREIVKINSEGFFLYEWKYSDNAWHKYRIGEWTPSGIIIKNASISGSVLQFGRNNLLTELKYGPTAEFDDNNALVVQGNDRISIESSAYQVRVTGHSVHVGVQKSTSQNAYLDINKNYAQLKAETSVTLSNGTISLTLSGGSVSVTGGNISGYVESPLNQKLKLMTTDSRLYVYKDGVEVGSIPYS